MTTKLQIKGVEHDELGRDTYQNEEQKHMDRQEALFDTVVETKLMPVMKDRHGGHDDFGQVAEVLQDKNPGFTGKLKRVAVERRLTEEETVQKMKNNTRSERGPGGLAKGRRVHKPVIRTPLR
jgi:hypothetical protein